MKSFLSFFYSLCYNMHPRGERGMKRLPNRELTEEEYNETYNRLSRRYCGSEGSVILNFRPGVARKVFLNTYQIERKLPKLVWLYQNEEKLDNDVKILSTVSYQDKFFSYDMTYDQDVISFSSRFIAREKLLYYLRLSKDKLDKFHKLDAVYGDVKADNILINPKTGVLSFCDLDNIQIEDKYPADTLSDYLELFADEDGFVKENADSYMHSLMTLSVLDSACLEYYQILQMIEDGHHFSFLEQSAQPTLEKINDAIFDYKGDYLVDYVKKK